MFSQTPEAGCTLLLNVNNELKDVAKGHIVMPQNKIFHSKDMPLACIGFAWIGCYRAAKIWILLLNRPWPKAS